MLDEDRPCNTRNRKKNRYTRKELENLVVLHNFPLSTMAVKKMTMDDLCKYLKEKNVNQKPKLNCVVRSNVGLRQHQKNVVKYMNHHDRLLVYHKMGTGKTITAVTVSQCFLDKNPNAKVVVISPASLLDNFRKGMMEYGNIHYEKNYEFYSIQKCTNLLKENKLDCHGKLVIIDEVHNYKADIRIHKSGKILTGKNALEGYKCFLNASKLLLLTGTPLYNRPIDLTLYKVLLNYDKDKMNNVSIFDIIKYFKKEPIEILKCKLSYYAIDKGDKDFPKRIDKQGNIKMLPQYEAEYKKILSELEPNVEKKVIPKVFQKYKTSNENQFLNLTRRATQNIDNNVILNQKLFYVKSLVDKYQKKNKNLHEKDRFKIVIYSQFKDHGINLIKNIINVPYETISGDSKVSDRAKIVQDYNKGKISVLFITKAGGEGLDLKGTDAIVIMEPTWNDNSSEQVIARAIRYKSHEHRSDSRKKVMVYRLCHVASSDLTKHSEKFIKKYLADATSSIPKVQDLASTLISCDLIMEIFQKAKQNVLNAFDVALQNLSIEKNSCS